MAQKAHRRRRRTAHVTYNSNCVFVAGNGKRCREPLPHSTLPTCTTPAAPRRRYVAAIGGQDGQP